MLSRSTRLTLLRWNFCKRHPLSCESSVRKARPRPRAGSRLAIAWGEPMVRVLPSERVLPNAQNGQAGSPLPEAKVESPPVIRRAEVVAFALVALLVICVVAVLWAAKAFFLPVVMAFVVGTMLSPLANFLQRHRIHRAFGALLIVATVGAGPALMIGLISSPLIDWSSPLPALASRLKH